jgi:BASS family bile acid:Na+ symporter
MQDTAEVLDSVRLNFTPDSLFFLNITLAFIMFGVALGIKVDHFKKIVYNPRSVIIGSISQIILLPAITFLLIIALGNKIIPSIAMGMILVAACPGGNISNFMTFLARGNAALSVSLTGIVTLGAVIITPLNFAFWGNLYNAYQVKHDASHLLQNLEIDFWQMLYTVFILLGIPLILGMVFSAKFPKTTDKIIKPVKFISILAFVGIVIMAFAKNYEHFVNHIGTIFLLVLLHNALALSSGFLLATSLKTSREDRRSITIETGIQNSGLGLVLIFNPKIFPPELAIGGMAVVTAWWGIWHILSGLSIAGFWSKIPLNSKND